MMAVPQTDKISILNYGYLLQHANLPETLESRARKLCKQIRLDIGKKTSFITIAAQRLETVFNLRHDLIDEQAATPAGLQSLINETQAGLNYFAEQPGLEEIARLLLEVTKETEDITNELLKYTGPLTPDPKKKGNPYKQFQKDLLKMDERLAEKIVNGTKGICMLDYASFALFVIDSEQMTVDYLRLGQLEAMVRRGCKYRRTFNQLLAVMLDAEKAKAEGNDYYYLGLSGLNEAYGVSEPEYTMEDIKKVNPRYKP